MKYALFNCAIIYYQKILNALNELHLMTQTNSKE